MHRTNDWLGVGCLTTPAKAYGDLRPRLVAARDIVASMDGPVRASVMRPLSRQDGPETRATVEETRANAGMALAWASTLS